MGGSSLAREFPRFTGESEHSLDEKGRLVVPARYREALGPTFMVAAAPADPCLILYPIVAWERVLQRLEDAATKDGAYRRFRRRFLAQAEDASCDAQGRLVIPPRLRAVAGLEREAISIGAISHVEIWNPTRLAAAQPTAEENERLVAELRLD